MTGTAQPIPAPAPPAPVRTRRDHLVLSIPPEASRTLAGFRNWIHSVALPPGCRISYLGGEVFIDMSPEMLGAHSAVKAELNHVLYGLARQRGLGLYCPDGVLLSNDGADVSNEPDAMLISNDALATGRARLVPSADGRDAKEVEGTVDMVCEVLSDSSATKDLVRLRDRYHRAGIPEYWLIDARGDDVQFDILRHTPAGYEPAPATDGWRPSAVFGSRFRLDRERDRFGVWTYTLHVAPVEPVAA